jgi:hypothetical protein
MSAWQDWSHGDHGDVEILNGENGMLSGSESQETRAKTVISGRPYRNRPCIRQKAEGKRRRARPLDNSVRFSVALRCYPKSNSSSQIATRTKAFAFRSFRIVPHVNLPHPSSAYRHLHLITGYRAASLDNRISIAHSSRWKVARHFKIHAYT